MSDTLGVVEQAPASRGFFGAMVDRIRTAITPGRSEPELASGPPGAATTVEVEVPLERFERAEDLASALRDFQPSYPAFGEPVMPAQIAVAGIIEPYEQSIDRIQAYVRDMPDAERGQVLNLLMSSNISTGLMQPLGPDNAIERIAHEWTMAGVGSGAADQMLAQASEVARTGEWPGRDTSLSDQPFGVYVVDAREEWDKRALQIDASSVSILEKARQIEALGLAPEPGEIVFVDRDGTLYQASSLQQGISSQADVIRTAALADRQIPYRQFGEDTMSLYIAEAGVVQPPDVYIQRLDAALPGLTQPQRDDFLDQIMTFTKDIQVTRSDLDVGTIDNIGRDLSQGSVGSDAVNEMIATARERTLNPEMTREPSLVEQPFGVTLVAAREEWDKKVLQIDASSMPREEKANQIEGLGLPPLLGQVAYVDRDGTVYQAPAFHQAIEVAAQEITEHFMAPEEYVRGETPGPWITPEAGVEYRINTGRSDDGFHTSVDIEAVSGAFSGSSEVSWSPAFSSRDEAMDYALDTVATLFPSHDLDPELSHGQEVGGHDL